LIHFDPVIDVAQPAAWTGAKPPPIPDAAHDAGHSLIASDLHDTIMLSGVLKAQLSFTDFHTV